MNGDPGTPEASVQESGSRPVGKGPLILAKLIISHLERKKQGNSSEYGEVLEKLSGKDMPACDMSKWLQALKLCVSHLDEDCRLLVAATLRLSWYTQSESVVDVYLDYLANLLSAQVVYVDEALSALTQALLGPKTLALATQTGQEEEEIYSNLHRGLQTLLETVPRATAQLVPALNKQYPFRTRGPNIQEVAIRNCLHVTTYCPTVTEDVLHLVVKKMITIDAEIRLEDDSSMELVIDADSELQFHVDMEQEPEMMTSLVGGVYTTTSSTEESQNGVTTPTDDSCRGDQIAPPPHLGPNYSKHRVMQNDMSENMDILMTVLMSHMRKMSFQKGQLVTEEAVGLLQTLFKIFSDVILPTHAISHVQFLVFYLISFHKDFPGVFLDFLWKKFQDVSVSAVLRQTAATYMASFIARSKFVSTETARLCLLHMMNWLHQYVDVCDPSILGPSVARHGPFFSLCQSVFYVFVFRHQSLVQLDNGLSFLRSLNFERIIASKLNPLRVCLPSVVERFSKLASHHEVVFCYTILEANKRLMLMAASLGGQSVTPFTNHLDSFFPFDPYFLHRSSAMIQPLYQEWEGEGETEEEEEEEEEEREDGDTKGQIEEEEEEDDSLPSSHLSASLGQSIEATPTYCDSTFEPSSFEILNSK